MRLIFARALIAILFGMPFASIAQTVVVGPESPVLPSIAPTTDAEREAVEAALQERIGRLAALDVEIRAADALAKGLLNALTDAKDDAAREALHIEFEAASAQLRAALARFNAEVNALNDLTQEENQP